MRRVLTTLGVVAGIRLSETSAGFIALGLSLMGIAISVLALVLVLRLMGASAPKGKAQIQALDHLAARADSIDDKT